MRNADCGMLNRECGMVSPPSPISHPPSPISSLLSPVSHLPHRRPLSVICYLLSVICYLLSAPAASAAGALGTRFALVEMADVVPGKVCAVALADGSYYSLRNSTELPLKVRLECRKPSLIEPCPGTNYVAIADTAWVRFDPPAFDLPPRSEAESLITVAIPDAPEHYGRHYEFWVRADALAGQAAVALTSRVRLHTVAAPPAEPPVGQKPREAAVRSLDKPKTRSFWSRLAFWRRSRAEGGADRR